MNPRTPRLLFCLPTTQLSGGVKIVFEVMCRLHDAGWDIRLFSYASKPRWYELTVPLLGELSLAQVDFDAYDFVLVSNAFFVPLVLPHLRTARLIFFAQDYESFHHGPGGRYRDFISDLPALSAIYRLPVPIIATSKAIRSLVRDRLGKETYYMPVGLDKAAFVPMPRTAPESPKRVLLIGNYLMPYKGMRDAFEALRLLSAEMSVQLVLITQETRGRNLFDRTAYAIEIHSFPTDEHVPRILASCHVLCCASYYEGLGLPALEAFCCGVPVVSTRTYGVSDYGKDGVNLLLANPDDPKDLADKLRTVLRDQALANSLVAHGLETVKDSYDWDQSIRGFRKALDHIQATYDGAGSVNAEEMRRISAELEAEGCWTPIEVTWRFKEIAGSLEALCVRLADGDGGRDDVMAEVVRLRGSIEAYLANPAAQYYGAFKSRYDLCQLVLAFRDLPELPSYLRKIMSVRAHTRFDAATFSETRYRF